MQARGQRTSLAQNSDRACRSAAFLHPVHRVSRVCHRHLSRNALRVRASDSTAVEQLRDELLSVCQDTSQSRGKRNRGRIEELQVAVEQFGGDIDYRVLQGLWKLRYTTAPDVAPLLASQRGPAWSLPLPIPKVGSIYQRFSGAAEGHVQNIIQAGDGLLFAKGNGVTFVVDATYVAAGPRTIKLMFQSAGAQDLRIADSAESVIATALLPRTTIQQQILLWIREAALKLPLPTPSGVSGADGAAAGRYLLSYMDDRVLIGRAQAGAGVFIFERVDELDLERP